MRYGIWGAGLLLAGCASVWAEQPGAQEADALQPQADPPASTEPAPAAPAAVRPEDVTSIENIVTAFYAVVSGPAGTPRQWERDRALYMPEARLVSIGVTQGESQPRAKVMSHEQFVEGADAAMVQHGFYERERNRLIQRFGNVAHVWSTYETRQAKDGPVLERGVNSMSLYYDGTRWWITSVLWDIERSGNAIPDSLQPWGLDCGSRGKKPGKTRKKK
jgi:hypothetical protein